MKRDNKTIFALATNKGKSAIAVFRVSGANSHKVIKSISSKKKFKNNFATLNNLMEGEEIIDQTITTFFKSPNSYTGENMVEISCHGSVSVINKITEIFLERNMRLAEPGEFTKRALINDKLTVLEAETINDLVSAETEYQRKIAIGNLGGNLDKIINDISSRVKKLLADVEALIDFADEDLPKKMILNIKEQNKNIRVILKDIINKSNLTKKIYDGFKITIIGKPNTGKSSFINYINNAEISIVTSKPGTTTDLVSSTLDIKGNKFTFIDTAGIRKHRNLIEKIGIEKSIKSARISDLNIVFLKNDEKNDYKNIKSKIFVKSKYDVNKKKINKVHNISSVTGFGVKSLLNKISTRLINNHLDGALFSRERHIENLKQSLNYHNIVNFNEIDKAAEDIRGSLKCILGINQKFDIEKILDIIFSDFCIGK